MQIPFFDSYPYVQPPQPSLNGGLYTGEPFKMGAAYANVPVTPDASYIIHENLKTADPPPGATFQYPSGHRPGNNFHIMNGVSTSKGQYQNFACNHYACSHQSCSGGHAHMVAQKKPSFFKYAYLAT